MSGLVLLGVATMGTSLIIQPQVDTLPPVGHGARAQVPYQRWSCPPSATVISTAASQLRDVSGSPTRCPNQGESWLSGPGDCRMGQGGHESCGDFAGWPRHQTDGFVTHKYLGDLDPPARSSYERRALGRTWRPVGTSNLPLPGDVPVYGINLWFFPRVTVLVVHESDAQGPVVAHGYGRLLPLRHVAVHSDDYFAGTV
jgi:hypothetical protein